MQKHSKVSDFVASMLSEDDSMLSKNSIETQTPDSFMPASGPSKESLKAKIFDLENSLKKLEGLMTGTTEDMQKQLDKFNESQVLIKK